MPPTPVGCWVSSIPTRPLISAIGSSICNSRSLCSNLQTEFWPREHSQRLTCSSAVVLWPICGDRSPSRQKGKPRGRRASSCAACGGQAGCRAAQPVQENAITCENKPLSRQRGCHTLRRYTQVPCSGGMAWVPVAAGAVQMHWCAGFVAGCLES